MTLRSGRRWDQLIYSGGPGAFSCRGESRGPVLGMRAMGSRVDMGWPRRWVEGMRVCGHEDAGFGTILTGLDFGPGPGMGGKAKPCRDGYEAGPGTD